VTVRELSFECDRLGLRRLNVTHRGRVWKVRAIREDGPSFLAAGQDLEATVDAMLGQARQRDEAEAASLEARGLLA